MSLGSYSVKADEITKEYETAKTKIESKQMSSMQKFKLFKKYSKLDFKKAEMEIIEEVEPNDTFIDANKLPIGAGAIASFSDYDVDYFKINVTTPGDLIVLGVYASDYDISLMDLAFLLSDKYDETLDVSSYYDLGTEAILYEDVPVGTYYIAALDLENFASGDPYVIAADIIEDETTLPLEPSVNQIDDNDKVVTGYAEPSMNINIEANGKLIAKGKSNSKGNFSVAIKPIKAGTIVDVYVVDNKNNNSNYVSLTVLDKTPPATLTVNKITTKSKTITGKTEAAATVSAKVGSKSLGSAKADSKGNYKISIKAQKKNSTVTVTATDKAGNKKVTTSKVK